jgi:hypothetical protein
MTEREILSALSGLAVGLAVWVINKWLDVRFLRQLEAEAMEREK